MTDPNTQESSTSLESGSTPEAVPTPFDTEGATITDAEAKNWCMFAHLSALCGLIGVPFGSILGPLIIWLIKKDAHPAVDYHGKEALNFNICIFIYILCCLPFILVFGLGVLMMFAVGIFALVMIIMAAVKVSNGEPWRYPYIFRLIS